MKKEKKTEQEIKELEEIQEEDKLPTTDDIWNAIKKLKNKGSPGPDNTIAELLKTQQSVL
jgi:hypothetical protein